MGDPQRLAGCRERLSASRTRRNRLRRIEEQKSAELVSEAFLNKELSPGNFAVNRKLGNRSPERRLR